jgi:hypothetical protein
MSVLLFGFCMARIAALVMRIVWASRLTNVRIAIAANIFTAAGVVLLFIVNLIFAQRLVRAYHPHFGWKLLPTTLFFRFLIFSVVAMLIMVITATVLTFYTLNPNTRRICRDIQLFSGTYLAALAFLPIPIVLVALIWPRSTPIDKFGQGRFRTKVRLVVFTSFLLSLGAGFRVGVSYDTRPVNKPAWFHHKACYYCFNYAIELIVVYTYALLRFDRRFHVPDGSSAPGHYSKTAPLQRKMSLVDRVNSEAEAFGTDGTEPPTSEEAQAAAERGWERRAQRELEKQDGSAPPSEDDDSAKRKCRA